MSALKNDRRNFITAAASIGAGALLPTPSLAQTGNAVAFSLTKFTPSEAGREHTDRLRQIRGTLDGNPPISSEGLSRLVDALMGLKVISKDEAVTLKKLITDIMIAESLEILTDKVTGAYKALTNKVGDVAQAVIRIAHDSVRFAKEFVAGIDVKMTIYVVCNDIFGALTGAATGGQLGGTPGALVGAVVGAVSNSAIAVFAPKR